MKENLPLIDIFHTPFSRYGAYTAVTAEADGRLIFRFAGNRPGEDACFDLLLIHSNRAVNYTIKAHPDCVLCQSPEGFVRFYVRDDETIVFDSKNIDLFFRSLDNTHYGSFGIEDGEKSFRIILSGRRIHALFTIQQGKGTMPGSLVGEGARRWNGMPVNHKNEIRLNCTGGSLLGAVKFSKIESGEITLPIDPEKEIAAVREEWAEFSAKMPLIRMDTVKNEFARITWYNLWSCFARAGDTYKFDTMLMSKKTMTAVWSWDHCFNALSVAPLGPQKALEQFLAPFVLQAPNGALPDLWNPGMEILWNFTKPPIHGWCFGKLMDKFEYTTEILIAVYNYLEKQLSWWFNYRDEDGDGIPCYAHGNDSGWDNSTVFDNGYYMVLPDLSAFLILQMHTLARISDKLDRASQALSWRKRAGDLLEKLMGAMYKNGVFVALQSHTHDYRPDPSSLHVHLPVVLGELLDPAVMDAEAAILEKRFLTEYGLATEAPDSPRYEADGYWRGPIWAPPTYLIVDGLRRGGHEKLAETIARRYLRLSAETAKGNYENFDALSGRGLRAPGYTWSASVYMLFCEEYPESAVNLPSGGS
jgi:hypothetical protein